MVEVNVDVDQRPGASLSTAWKNIIRLGSNLPSSMDDMAEQMAEDLRNEIHQSVISNGLQDGERDPPLSESFIVREKNLASADFTYRISSDHPGALPLEEGASPHRIEPDEADALAWTVTNPKWLNSPYYNVARNQVVFHHGVDHPGNRAYRYVLQAQFVTEPERERQVRSYTADAITDSGFRRSLSR